MEVASPIPESSTHQLRRLYRFVATRRFVAARAELTAAGFSRSRIDSRVRNGRLIRILRAVYSYGRDVESPEAVRRAALLAVGAGSALIGRSACEAWGMVTPRPGLPIEVEVGVGVGQARTLPGRSPALRHTKVRVARRRFEPGGIRRRHGLALAAPSLALIDFAAGASEREVRFAFLEACRLGLFSEADVVSCFRRMAGRPGAKRLKPCLALWVPDLGRTRSVLEGWFLLTWAERGLPMPRVNARVLGYEVDGYWPEHHLVLELDGDAFHRDPVRRSLDTTKQRVLESSGLTVVRVTYKQFEADPDAAVARVASSLGPAWARL